MARETGFTVDETAQLVRGFARPGMPSPRWTRLAAAKMRELDASIARAHEVKAVLRRISRCRCASLSACGKRLMMRRQMIR